MKFSIAPTVLFLVINFCAAASAEMVLYCKQWNVKLQSMPPSQMLTKLDLDRPGLEAVKAAAGKGDQPRAKSADYGSDIDWTINPADDIEWMAAVYRFYWTDDLTKAYTATCDEKYARAFVELTTDWIAKHPRHPQRLNDFA